MGSRRLPVRMDDDLYAALQTFAVEQDRSMANVMLHATRAYLSQHKAWSNRATKTQPRATRTRANGNGRVVGDTGSAIPEVGSRSTSTGGDI